MDEFPHNRIRRFVRAGLAPLAFTLSFGAILSGLTSSVEISPALPVLLVLELSVGLPLSWLAHSTRSRLVAVAALAAGGLLSLMVHALVFGIFCERPQMGLGVLFCWVFIGLWFPMLMAPLLVVARACRNPDASQQPVLYSAAAALGCAGALGMLAAMDGMGRILPLGALVFGTALFARNKGWIGRLTVASRAPSRSVYPRKSLWLACGTGIVVTLCVVLSFDRAPRALRERYEHYEVSPFDDYGIEGVSLWHIGRSSSGENGPVVGWDQKLKMIVESERLFRRARGLSPDDLARRYQDMVRSDARGLFFNGEQASSHQVAPPSVRDGKLIYYAHSLHSPEPERVEVALEPGMLAAKFTRGH